MNTDLDRLKTALADRYAIEREIGSGGMAVVYLAEDVKHRRKVAVKVLRPELAESLGAERFLREIEVTANLNHPHILPLLDSGSAEEQPSAGRPSAFLFYVMPFIEGESLRDRLTREGQLPLDDALQITMQVAAALSYAHSQGVIHRDVKPENILLSAGEAVVADFGIARAVSEAGAERLTETGLAVGTPAYMSPEQASGEHKLDGRSDIYSLGCVLYEMLAGDAPFTASTPQAIIAKKLAEPTPRIRVIREAVPLSIEAALTRALVKNPADRFVTAQQFAEALEASTEAIPTARTAVVSPDSGGWRPGRRWLVALAVVVAVAVAGVLRFPGLIGGDSAAGVGEIDRLVVAPFENRTGDPSYADVAFMAAEFITRSIDRTGVATVVPARDVRDLLRDDDPNVPMTLEEITDRTSARYAVAGSYSISAGRLRFDVEVTDAESGELLRSLDPTSGSVDSLDTVIALMTERVTAATVALLSTDLDPAIGRAWSAPPSLDAVRGLLATQDMFCRGRWQDAIDEAEAALQQAPDFAPLLVTSLIAYSNLGRINAADSVLTQIEQLREQLTTQERLLVDMTRGNLYGDHAEHTRAVEQAYRMYPASFGFHAGWNAARLNRFSDALERLLASDIDSPCYRIMWFWWVQTAEVYLMLGRNQDALDIVRDGLQRFPNVRPLLRYEAVSLAALGQMEAVDSLLDVITGLPVQSVLGYQYSPGSQTAYIAVEFKGMGLHEAYEAAMDRSLAWFTARPDRELRFYRGEALYYAERWSDADTIFAALIADPEAGAQFIGSRGEPADVAFRGFGGVTLAHLGRREEAQEIDRWLAQLDRPYLRGVHTRWRAAIVAALGERAAAVQLLDQAIEEGIDLGYLHHRRGPEWESLRDYEPYQLLMRPEQLDIRRGRLSESNAKIR